MKLPQAILAFDLDGTLTPRNQFQILPQGLTELLNSLSQLGYYAIPVTGKPAAYAANLFSVNQLQDWGIVAENAGVFRYPEHGRIEVFGPGIEQMQALREKLGIGMTKVNVTEIAIGKDRYQVVVDPDDVSILTIFTDPSFVKHRWSFKQTISADELQQKLTNLISATHWQENLLVLPPFPDGALQVIRKFPEEQKIIDKSMFLANLSKVYSNAEDIPVAFFGDGHNDVPAMNVANVIPITFANAHQLAISCAISKNGFVSQYGTPDDFGVVDGLYWLSDHGFFQNYSLTVKKLIKERFPHFKTK